MPGTSVARDTLLEVYSHGKEGETPRMPPNRDHATATAEVPKLAASY